MEGTSRPSPGPSTQNRGGDALRLCRNASIRADGSCSPSSARRNVPKWIPALTSAPRTSCASSASSGDMCTGDMNHSGRYAPIGSRASTAVATSRERRNSPPDVRRRVGEVHRAGGTRDHEARPERAIPIEEPAPRKVLRRDGGHPDSLANAGGFPPVELVDVARSPSDEHGPVGERHEDPGAVLGRETIERRDVQVIVVVMADERDVDRRKLLPCQTRGVDALRSREGDRARALRPDRIGQDVQPVHLDEDGRVVDERDAHRAAPDAVRGIGRRRDLRPLSPRTCRPPSIRPPVPAR